MISWEVVGLLGAIETYDPGKRAKFESYAISKVRWAIIDQLRSQDWVPCRIRLRAQEIEKATAKLIQELRRPPTKAEIAWEAGMRVGEYHDFLDQYSRAQVASLGVRVEVDGETAIEYVALVEDPSAVDPQYQANVEELRAHLIDAISQLEER